jgi:uncharacterized phage protein (TIGR02218 family)
VDATSIVASTTSAHARITLIAAETITANTPTSLLMTLEAVEVAASTAEVPPPLRLTQEAIEIVADQPNALRLSTLVRFSLIEVASTGRVTYMARLSLIELFAAARVTYLARLTLCDAVPCLTFWATMWRLRRTDGQVFAFTSHDQDLTFRGDVYKTCASLQASATEQGAMLGDIGNMELLGMITDDSITEEDLFAGRFDGADLEVWLYPWSDAGGETPRRLIAGKTGNLSQRVNAFTMEVLTISQQLQQKAIVEVVTPNCRYDLGDERCTVDLEALRSVGEVQSLAAINAHNQANKRIFFDPVFRTEDDGYWNAGQITFTSGDNNGLTVEVKSFDQATGELVLWEPLTHPLQVGDAYSIVPGCDKSVTTCKAKFNNYINFGGFPNVPGGDAVSQTPNAGGGGNVSQNGPGGKFG